MQSTSNVGNAEHAGSQSTPLERLRPFQIATLLLPGTNVQVMDATDAQFEAFLVSQSLAIVDGEIAEWSFDDRVRLINFARKNGVDLFAQPNKNNSEPEQKQFGNNSENELIGELFDGGGVAPQAVRDDMQAVDVFTVRHDIDLLLEDMKKSSKSEQKEFGGE